MPEDKNLQRLYDSYHVGNDIPVLVVDASFAQHIIKQLIDEKHFSPSSVNQFRFGGLGCATGEGEMEVAKALGFSMNNVDLVDIVDRGVTRTQESWPGTTFIKDEVLHFLSNAPKNTYGMLTAFGLDLYLMYPQTWHVFCKEQKIV